ncbi:MAG: hypothetical protein OEV80_04165 [candidate division Zixibacteria bacterium]|nr:hypothetical protein [candidate division Zixibacteria bacterium]
MNATTLPEPAEMNAAGTANYTVISSFTVNDRAGWILGLVPVNPPAGDNHYYLKTILDREIQAAGGDAVINVTLRGQYQFTDFLIGLVLPVYSTRTLTVTGDVIKYN